MLSVVIAAEHDERGLVATLAALVPASAAGVVRDVVLVDRHAETITATIADAAGCDFLIHDGSRGAMLATGVRQARSPWLLFLPPGAVLDANWIDEIGQFMQNAELRQQPRAAIFSYARSPYADTGLRAGLAHLLRMVSGPSADQGLVIARNHYEALGGHDVHARDAETRLLRKLGRARIVLHSRIRMT
jgi:hypothetical protein